MSEITYAAAFLGGLLMFLAPCTLPLVPTYLAFLGGGAGKGRMLMRASAFILGFASVIIAAGFFAGTFGVFLKSHHSLLFIISGTLFVLSGLFILGIIRGAPGRGLPAFFVPSSTRGVFMLGAAFSLAWSPCIGPVLGAVYTLAASRSAGIGAMLLLATYVLGYAVPFLALAFFYERAEKAVAVISRASPMINRVSGVLLVAVGILMATGGYAKVAEAIGSMMGQTWTDKIMNYL